MVQSRRIRSANARYARACQVLDQYLAIVARRRLRRAFNALRAYRNPRSRRFGRRMRERR